MLKMLKGMWKLMRMIQNNRMNSKISVFVFSFSFLLFFIVELSSAQSISPLSNSKKSENNAMGETSAEQEDLEVAVAQKKAELEAKKNKKSKSSRTIPEKLGPRKGRLRDAGRFKTEMLARKSGVDVYLVNTNSQDPSVRGSSIEGHLYVGKKEYPLRFWPNRRKKRFFAKWPKGISIQGEKLALVMLPTRKRIVGAPVVYKMRKLY